MRRARLCPDSARTSSAAATASGTSPASASAASSTSAAPSAYDGSAARASSSASRVLPTPPVPASVSRRVPRSSALSSASSRPRPMNELASAGREAAGRRSPESSVASSSASSRGQLGELVPPLGRPVVVAVLRQQLAAVDARAPHGTRQASAPGAHRRRRAPAGRRRHRRSAAAPPPGPRSPPRRARAARRTRPDGGCSPPRPAHGRARAHPSPARGAGGGRARARAASRAHEPSSAARPCSGTGAPSTAAAKPPSSVTLIRGGFPGASTRLGRSGARACCGRVLSDDAGFGDCPSPGLNQKRPAHLRNGHLARQWALGPIDVSPRGS